MAINLILFLIYTSLIFFLKEPTTLICVALINLCLMLIFKISLKKMIMFILRLMLFILFTVLLNILLGSLEIGILIGIRLILVCSITYIYSSKMTPKRLQIAVEGLLFPLKIFKANTKSIGIIVSMAISFIPILQREIQNVKYSLFAKGYIINFKNFLKKPSLILMPIITSTIKKVAEIEQSMLSKGHID